MKGLFSTVLCFFILLLAAAIVSCGKKGPPVPPGIPELTPVTGFTHTLADGFVKFEWESLKGKEASILKGYIVYRSKTAIDKEPCAGCPILFEKAVELHKGSESFGEMVQRGYDYIYKVVAVSEYGKTGPDSEMIRFRYEME